MKKLFVFCISVFLFSSALAVDLNSFVQAVKKNQQRVAELTLLQKEAQKLGIKHVYLFGGTATAYARYVKEHLDQIEGAPYQKERFDYEHESIFRSEQDMDIVIDGNAEDAARLQARMQELAPHFIGESNSKTVWEVRLLKEKNGDKESLFSFDFQNQHSDSYSTGLIDLMECEGFDCIKDVRAFDQEVSPFLKDVFHNEISFYYSSKHFQTARYMGGLNPEILSVIRYYTKVVQYDAKTKLEDKIKLQSIIDHFDNSVVSNSKTYVKTWIEKNAKKLMVNAVDMEAAQDIITSTKLKQKLIALGDKNIPFSTAWYLNKSPLPTKPLGTTGKTAREIFGKEEIIVTHDTKSLAAYESLMKAKPGYVNAWQTRVGVPGEYPHGNEEGFYVMEGMVGHRHTGIPVHMKLNPNARYGEDFVFVGRDREIVIKNRAALTVIHESLSDLSITQLFQLSWGEESIFKDNKAMQNRIQKMVNARTYNTQYQGQINELTKYIEQIIKIPSLNVNLLKVWFSLDLSTKYSDFLETLIRQENTHTHQFIAGDILSQPHWAQHPRGAEFVEKLIQQGKADYYIASYILSKLQWAKHPKSAEWLETLIQKRKTDLNQNIAMSILSEPYWAQHPRGAEFVEMLIKQGDVDSDIARYILNKSYWQQHPQSAKLLGMLIEQGNAGEAIACNVLSQPYWAQHPRGAEFVEKLIQQRNAKTHLAESVFVWPHWIEHPKSAELLEMFIGQGEADWQIAKSVFNSSGWAQHPKGTELLAMLIARSKVDDILIKDVLNEPHWRNHLIIGKLRSKNDLEIFRMKMKMSNFCNQLFK